MNNLIILSQVAKIALKIVFRLKRFSHSIAREPSRQTQEGVGRPSTPTERPNLNLKENQIKTFPVTVFPAQHVLYQ
jgi:hypothetical protein